MDQDFDPKILLTALSPVGAALVLLTLLQRGLVWSYVWFTMTLLAEIAASTAYFVIPNPRTYSMVYPYLLGITWLTRILATYELYQKLFSPFSGIVRLARRLAIAASLVSIVVALYQASQMHSSAMSDAAKAAFLFAQPASVACSFFLLFLLFFLAWMPLPVPQNTARHILLFSSYFFVISGAYWGLRLFGKQNAFFSNNFDQAIYAGIFLVWAVSLTKQGEVALKMAKVNPQMAAQRVAALRKVNDRLQMTRKEIYSPK